MTQKRHYQRPTMQVVEMQRPAMLQVTSRQDYNIITDNPFGA